MKKLTKRNRKHNRKVVFGYACEPEQTSDYTTTFTGLLNNIETCEYSPGSCCDP